MKTKILILLLMMLMDGIHAQKYTADWNSIDSRPVPEWFVNAKFGIFIHWGVYSVPAYRPVGKERYSSYAEWYESAVMPDTVPGGRDFHIRNYGADFEYRDFAPMFRAELWDPDYWASLFKRAGARYVVLTSKHHDGFALWPSSSPYSKNWNSMDIGPHRDLLGELAKAVRNDGLKMGIYYSLMEWESVEKADGDGGTSQKEYIPDSLRQKYGIKDPAYVNDHMIPQIRELVMKYQPALIFADGEWDKPDSYWKSKEILAWIYNNAPNRDEIVVNDRWGMGTRGHHGGYYTSEYSSDADQMSAHHPWEESRGIGGSYGYNRAENIDDYNTSEDLIFELVDIVSRGGNLLLNIGPAADGTIPVIMQQRLVDIGNWLKTNGEAIYDTRAWKSSSQVSGNSAIYFTTKGNDLYVISRGWPTHDIEINGLPGREGSRIEILGSDVVLKSDIRSAKFVIPVKGIPQGKVPCEYGYVFKIGNIL